MYFGGLCKKGGYNEQEVFIFNLGPYDSVCSILYLKTFTRFFPPIHYTHTKHYTVYINFDWNESLLCIKLNLFLTEKYKYIATKKDRALGK